MRNRARRRSVGGRSDTLPRARRRPPAGPGGALRHGLSRGILVDPPADSTGSTPSSSSDLAPDRLHCPRRVDPGGPEGAGGAERPAEARPARGALRDRVLRFHRLAVHPHPGWRQPHPGRRQPQPGLLRDRHPVPGPPGRCGLGCGPVGDPDCRIRRFGPWLLPVLPRLGRNGRVAQTPDPPLVPAPVPAW